MSLTIHDLKQKFPGEWEHYQHAFDVYSNVENAYRLKNAYAEIAYTCYRGRVEYFDLFDYSNYTFDIVGASLNQVENFYKLHFKLATFK